MSARPKRRSPDEVQRSRAESLLTRMKPYDRWLREAPRSETDRQMYHRIVSELQAIVAGSKLEDSDEP
jgi:hypothetical protein